MPGEAAHSQSVCTTGGGLGRDAMSLCACPLGPWPAETDMTWYCMGPKRLINGIDKFIEGDTEEVRSCRFAGLSLAHWQLPPCLNGERPGQNCKSRCVSSRGR